MTSKTVSSSPLLVVAHDLAASRQLSFTSLSMDNTASCLYETALAEPGELEGLPDPAEVTNCQAAVGCGRPAVIGTNLLEARETS